MSELLRSEKYSQPAVLLHWTIAVLIVVQFGLGWIMEELPEGPEKTSYFALHKSVGITIFFLAVLRLGWRVGHRPPALPSSMTPWERSLAGATHALLYVLIFLQPLSGYLSSSFSGYRTSFFGWPLPHWGWKDPVLNDFFSELHEANALLLLVVALTHIAGALRHALRPGDHVFRRMLP